MVNKTYTKQYPQEMFKKYEGAYYKEVRDSHGNVLARDCCDECRAGNLDHCDYIIGKKS